MNRAVFFDKDGVLNKDIDPLTNIERPEFFEAAADIVAYVRSFGFFTFVVTNQTVVSRGLTDELHLLKLIEFYRDRLIQMNSNSQFDDFYYCPHHPNADVERYRIICECRKPKPGMLLLAAAEHSIDLAGSYLVGDRPSDIIAGKLAGCVTVHCRSGRHIEAMIETDLITEKSAVPDIVIENISELRKVLA